VIADARLTPRERGSAGYRAAMALDLFAVWELAEHRSLFIEEDAERAGSNRTNASHI
jgi:hypothetical protein